MSSFDKDRSSGYAEAFYTLRVSAPKGLCGVNPITMTARMQLAAAQMIAVDTVDYVKEKLREMGLEPEEICRNFEVQHQGKSRLEEITARMAEGLHVNAKVEYPRSVDPMVTSKELADRVYPALVEIVGEKMVEEKAVSFLTFGADDFAMVCSRVPGMYLSIGAGSPEEGYTVMGHRDKVMFNEEVLATGVAVFANAAYTWLKAAKEA